MDTWTNSNWWSGYSEGYAHWGGQWTPGLIALGEEVVQRAMHTMVAYGYMD